MEFSINIYGVAPCIIEPVCDSKRQKCLLMFKEAFISRVKSKSIWTPFGSTGSEFQRVMYSFVHGSDGYGYCAIWNTEKNMDVRAVVRIEGTNVNFSILY